MAIMRFRQFGMNIRNLVNQLKTLEDIAQAVFST